MGRDKWSLFFGGDSRNRVAGARIGHDAAIFGVSLKLKTEVHTYEDISLHIYNMSKNTYVDAFLLLDSGHHLMTHAIQPPFFGGFLIISHPFSHHRLSAFLGTWSCEAQDLVFHATEAGRGSRAGLAKSGRPGGSRWRVVRSARKLDPSEVEWAQTPGRRGHSSWTWPKEVSAWKTFAGVVFPLDMTRASNICNGLKLEVAWRLAKIPNIL